jgi:hypothetical protein
MIRVTSMHTLFDGEPIPRSGIKTVFEITRRDRESLKRRSTVAPDFPIRKVAQ